MICGSCKAIVDDCWRWCPQCGGQFTDEVRSDPGEQDYFSVEWIIETEPAQSLFELTR